MKQRILPKTAPGARLARAMLEALKTAQPLALSTPNHYDAPTPASAR